MSDHLFPKATRELARRRRDLAPAATEAFENFSRTVFAAGALDEKTKQLIAVAVAHVTQCPYCIRGHTKGAHAKGATDEEIMEAIYVAAEMRAGGAYAHSALALDVLEGFRGDAADGTGVGGAGVGGAGVGGGGVRSGDGARR